MEECSLKVESASLRRAWEKRKWYVPRGAYESKFPKRKPLIIEKNFLICKKPPITTSKKRRKTPNESEHEEPKETIIQQLERKRATLKLERICANELNLRRRLRSLVVNRKRLFYFERKPKTPTGKLPTWYKGREEYAANFPRKRQHLSSERQAKLCHKVQCAVDKIERRIENKVEAQEKMIDRLQREYEAGQERELRRCAQVVNFEKQIQSLVIPKERKCLKLIRKEEQVIKRKKDTVKNLHSLQRELWSTVGELRAKRSRVMVERGSELINALPPFASDVSICDYLPYRASCEEVVEKQQEVESEESDSSSSTSFERSQSIPVVETPEAMSVEEEQEMEESLSEESVFSLCDRRDAQTKRLYTLQKEVELQARLNQKVLDELSEQKVTLMQQKHRLMKKKLKLRRLQSYEAKQLRFQRVDERVTQEIMNSPDVNPNAWKKLPDYDGPRYPQFF